MAIRKVIIVGDELLRKISRPVEKFDDKLIELLEDMYDTLKKENGAGLSAVQVGILKRVFIMEVEPGRKYECINPEILSTSKTTCTMLEGCLSIPDKSGKVKRPKEVVLKYYDRYGKEHVDKFVGFEARCVCHENDHLNGILYIDKIENNKKMKEHNE